MDFLVQRRRSFRCRQLLANNSFRMLFLWNSLSSRHRLYAVLLAVVLGVSWGLVALLDPPWVTALAGEDGLFEWTGAVAFLAASALFFVGFVRDRGGNDLVFFRTSRNVLLLGLSLVFFVGFGEEISWGQRVLGFESPAWFSEHNRQRETNIHNLAIFHGTEASGARKSGAAAWLNIDCLFTLSCLTWLLVLPLAAMANRTIAEQLRRMSVPLPPAWVGALFLVNYAVSKILESGIGPDMAHSVVEVKECNAALVVLTAAVLITHRAPGHSRLLRHIVNTCKAYSEALRIRLS